MTTYVFLWSAADVLLVVVKLLVGGLVIGVALAGLRRWLFGPPKPHRTDVRRSDATYAKGRAEVVWSDSHSPDLSRVTTSDLLGSVERARR